MLFTLTAPVLLSFDKKVSFFKKWKYLPLPIVVTTAYFVIWDYFFTKFGVWSFNEHYILGYSLFLLPLEEWLFFIVVPFACIFIYECTNYYIKKDFLKPYAYSINLILLLFIVSISLLNIEKAYTAFNFISAALLMVFIQFLHKPKWLGRFYVGYLFSLIPFFIVNGLLTYLPVVRYNDAENLGVRIMTIPVEDTIYCLLLLLMNVTLYEFLKSKAE